MKSVGAEHCELIAPQSAADWAAYHDIRRRILFENRGEHGVYDANRSDDQAPGHFPRVLKRASAYIGVVRVDVADGTAYLRRVAIDEPHQRQGLGRTLLALAEAFARAQSATRVESSVAPDAVPFYLKCGYRLVAAEEAGAAHPQMYKDLAPREA
jgi:GNAT superfamily N-acetyltransferase